MIKKGQILYVEPIGNAARYDKEISPCEVESVGRKYFYLKGHQGRRFFIDTMKQDGGGFSPNYQCHLSMQDILDRNEKSELIRNIKSIFSVHKGLNLSLNQLREIDKIIKS